MQIKLEKLKVRHFNKALKFIEKIFGKEDASDARKHFTFELNKSNKYRFLSHFVAEKGNKIIAITGLYSPKVHPKSIIWLSWLAVDKNYMHKGTGSYLFNWTEKKAANLGFKYLYVVSTPQARSFYSKIGFKLSKADKLKKWYFPRGSLILYKKL